MKVLRFSLGDFRTNSYFVFNENGDCVLFDVGMDGEGMFEIAKNKGIIPQKVILTHGHFDHSEGAKAFCEKSGAKLLIHEADNILLQNPNFNCANFHYHGETENYPVTTADETFCDGDVIVCGELSFAVMHTPGHTEGSCTFDDGANLFTGDTMFNNGYGRCDLYGGDFQKLKESLGKICSIQGDRKIYPGHGNTSLLSKERAFYSFLG